MVQIQLGYDTDLGELTTDNPAFFAQMQCATYRDWLIYFEIFLNDSIFKVFYILYQNYLNTHL